MSVVESQAIVGLTSKVLYPRATLRFPLRVWLNIPARVLVNQPRAKGGLVQEGVVPYLRVVTSENERFEEFTAQDVARLQAAVGHLRRLVDDPIALIERAKRLLEGTAPKLFAVPSVPGLIWGLAGLDIPGPFDDAARWVVASVALVLPSFLVS